MFNKIIIIVECFEKYVQSLNAESIPLYTGNKASNFKAVKATKKRLEFRDWVVIIDKYWFNPCEEQYQKSFYVEREQWKTTTENTNILNFWSNYDKI